MNKVIINNGHFFIQPLSVSTTVENTLQESWMTNS